MQDVRKGLKTFLIHGGPPGLGPKVQLILEQPDSWWPTMQASSGAWAK